MPTKRNDGEHIYEAWAVFLVVFFVTGESEGENTILKE